MSPTPSRKPSRYRRTIFWSLALLGLAVLCIVLRLLMPPNGLLTATLIATLILFVGVLVLMSFHFVMWSWLEESPSNDPVVIPPDRQGRRGPPHRNGSHRPGDPFYCK